MTINSTEPLLQWKPTEPGVWEARKGKVALEVFAADDGDPQRCSWFVVDFATGHCIDSGRATGLVAAQLACEAVA